MFAVTHNAFFLISQGVFSHFLMYSITDSEFTRELQDNDLLAYPIAISYYPIFKT